METKRRGTKRNRLFRIRRCLALAICAGMTATSIAAPTVFADTDRSQALEEAADYDSRIWDMLPKATPDNAERMDELEKWETATSSNAFPSEATPSNAVAELEMVSLLSPTEENLVKVGPKQKYRSIQGAINYIAEKQKRQEENQGNWIIQVEEGSYGRFLVPHEIENLTIQGAGQKTVISTLNGSSLEKSAGSTHNSDNQGIMIWGKNITLKDIKIESGKKTKDVWYASAVGTEDMQQGSGDASDSGLTLENCVFEGKGVGIAVMPQRSVFTVTDCSFDGYEQAIRFDCDNYVAKNCQITENTIKNCIYAVHGYFGGEATDETGTMKIQGNEISGTSERFAVIAVMDQRNQGSLKLDAADNRCSYTILGGINQRKDGDVAQGSMEELFDANELQDCSFVADAYWYSKEDYGTAFYAPKETGKIAVWHADPLLDTNGKDKVEKALDDYGTAGQFIEINAPEQELFTVAKNAVLLKGCVDAGDLKITKQVLGNEHDSTEFSFTVQFLRADGRVLNGRYDYVGADGRTYQAKLKDGQMTVSMKAGESVVIKDLLPGTRYEVKEEANAAYASACDSASGEIEAKKEKEVVYQNTYQGSELPDIPTPDWSVSKSKTAEQLDKNYESKVTLSLPAYDYKPAVDVVMVVDVSSSMKDKDIDEAKKAAVAMCDELASRQKVDTRVGIVTFDRTAHELTNGLVSIEEAKHAIAQIKTEYDTNMMAGLVAGKRMLDQGTAEDKYLVLLSDGIPNYWVNEQGEAASKILYQYRNLGEDGKPIVDNQFPAGLEPESSANDMNQIRPIREILAIQDWASDSDEWYQNTNTGAIWDNGYKHTNLEKSIYKTAQYLMEEILGRYPLKLVAFGTDKYKQNVVYKYGENFCDWIGAQEGVSYYKISKPNYGGEEGKLTEAFKEISNEMIHVVDAGSSVIDEIGRTDDYDFAFMNSADRLSMSVNGVEEHAVKLDENTYGFFKDDKVDDGYQFVLYYHPDGCSYKGQNYGECFVWKINVPVTIDCPVQLTYQVKLTNPKAEAGTYGTYDRDGKAGYEGLYTNRTAVLYPVDSNGTVYEPEEFLKPTVSYTVKGGSTEPTDPEPTNPEPTNPEPTDPEPTNPEPTNPEPTNPEPTNPEPTNPEPTNPEPTNPEPTNPTVPDHTHHSSGGSTGGSSRGSGNGGPGVQTLPEETTVPETTVPVLVVSDQGLPKTGDHSSPMVWMLLITVGMAAAIYVVTAGKQDEE